MKTSNIIILGGLLGIGYYLTSTVKNTLGGLQFSFSKVHLDRLTWDLNLKGFLTYGIKNPTQTDVKIQYFKGKLYYGNYYLTDIEINQTIIKAGETAVQNVNFKTPVFLLLGEAQALIQDGQLFQIFHIEGTLITKVGTLPEMTIPVSQNIQFAGRYNGKKT